MHRQLAVDDACIQQHPIPSPSLFERGGKEKLGAVTVSGMRACVVDDGYILFFEKKKGAKKKNSYCMRGGRDVDDVGTERSAAQRSAQHSTHDMGNGVVVWLTKMLATRVVCSAGVCGGRRMQCRVSGGLCRGTRGRGICM